MFAPPSQGSDKPTENEVAANTYRSYLSTGVIHNEYNFKITDKIFLHLYKCDTKF